MLPQARTSTLTLLVHRKVTGWGPVAHRLPLKRTQHVVPQLGIALVLLDEVGLLDREREGLQFALLGYTCVSGLAWGVGTQNKVCEKVMNTSDVWDRQEGKPGWTGTHLWASACTSLS